MQGPFDFEERTFPEDEEHFDPREYHDEPDDYLLFDRDGVRDDWNDDLEL